MPGLCVIGLGGPTRAQRGRGAEEHIESKEPKAMTGSVEGDSDIELSTYRATVLEMLGLETMAARGPEKEEGPSAGSRFQY